MTIVQPVEYKWLSCNAPDDDSIATWSSGSAYKKLAAIEHLGRIYKAAKDIASSKDEPSVAVNDWVDFGAVNSRAFCDEFISSASIKQTTGLRDFLELSINLSDYCDMFAFINLNAYKIEFIDHDFRKAKNWHEYFYMDFAFHTVKREVMNWWQYFYSPLEIKTHRVIQTPYKVKGELTIRIYGINDYAKLGMLVCGTGFYVGETLRGAQVGAISYTKKITDEWGNSIIRKGRTAKKNQYTVVTETSRSDSITDALNKSLEAGVCVFMGDSRDRDGYDSLAVMGILTEFDLTISALPHSELSIGIEGII